MPAIPAASPTFPDAQIEALIALCRDIVGRHPIPPHRVLAHSDVAPGRKLDPGERFPWARLAAAGIGHLVEPRRDRRRPLLPARRLRRSRSRRCRRCSPSTATASTSPASFDQRTEAVVAAFQRHFRPARVDGIADRSTIETLHNLLAALP